ncbi:MAG TPA: asparagine synthase C-terminal domain-containing protein [Allosphingosinicella sp.]|nr:asparagine synthase C-terminal domain-containing protein [Allosphingosinicella sp.]
MAALFLVSTSDPDYAQATIDGAREQFRRHGLSGLVERALPGWRLLHAPHIIGGPVSLFEDGDDMVAVAGTLTWDDLMGRPALEALLRAVSLPEPDWSRLGGQFVALVRRHGRCFLLTDHFAMFQLFHDPDMRLFSTSLLAAVGALPRVSFDPQGVYELAFNVTAIGDDTIFNELKTLGPDRVVELAADGARAHPVAKPLPGSMASMPIEERLERHRARLAAVVRRHVRHFGDHVHCPLSGGLDSRLVLAALRAEGCRPHIYVYGGPNDGDVQIARLIGEAQGFEVEWFDKEAARQVSPEEFPDQVERNFQEYDGLPNFGELFENGSNAAARDARHEGGALSASGGCGEIYRNFFYLPDRPLSADAVGRTFFARYAKGDLTGEFDERRFLRNIEDKILASLGLAGRRGGLPRAVVEQIYPRVRCRALFGREISLEGRYGAYLVPFLDRDVVAEAMTLPMALKNAGRFEARLLEAIDPELARLPSVYGHDFATPPTFRHRFDEWSTRIRPVWLRQKTYALRRRLGPMADEHGGLLSPDYMGRVVDLDYPVMRRFFHVDRINDSSLMRRIANLEYFAQRLGSKLTV